MKLMAHVELLRCRSGWSSRWGCPGNRHVRGLELRIALFVWMGSRTVDCDTTNWFGHGVGPCNVRAVHTWHVLALAHHGAMVQLAPRVHVSDV